jgi:hypothetical protein
MANPNRAAEFTRTVNQPEYKSTKTTRGTDHTEGARSGAVPSKARGVEHPIPEDMALIGSTQHKLHTAPLSKVMHPYKEHQNAGYPDSAGRLSGSDQFRVDCGGGTDGEI